MADFEGFTKFRLGVGLRPERNNIKKLAKKFSENFSMTFFKDETTTGFGYFRTFSAILKIIIVILCLIPTIILSVNFNEDVLKLDYGEIVPPILGF